MICVVDKNNKIINIINADSPTRENDAFAIHGIVCGSNTQTLSHCGTLSSASYMRLHSGQHPASWAVL